MLLSWRNIYYFYQKNTNVKYGYFYKQNIYEITLWWSGKTDTNNYYNYYYS